MPEKVLIPLDGSKVGESALHVIENFIKRLSLETKVEVTLLGVVTTLTHWAGVSEASVLVSYTEEELQAIQKRIMGYLDRSSEALRSKGVAVTTRVNAGHAAEEILKVAKEINADMIAMSTHGRSGLSRLAFGSVTDKVLRGAGMPVLTVRAPAGTINE